MVGCEEVWGGHSCEGFVWNVEAECPAQGMWSCHALFQLQSLPPTRRHPPPRPSQLVGNWGQHVGLTHETPPPPNPSPHPSPPTPPHPSQVTLVINYDVPVERDGVTPAYETYLHRIGRSGRFGRKGAAFNLICTGQVGRGGGGQRGKGGWCASVSERGEGRPAGRCACAVLRQSEGGGLERAQHAHARVWC